MMEELCSLLLPLDALLSHEDFHPQLSPTPLLTTRYRNLWLLCVLFGFTNASKRPDCMTEWHVQALMRIAEKTPPIVLEDTYGFVSAELEYNPILRQDYLQEACLSFAFIKIHLTILQVLQQHRTTLTAHIPLRHSEIKYLAPAHVVFLLTFHDLEAIRSARGFPSSVPTYFTNKDINARESLVICMDSVAEKVSSIVHGNACTDHC
jgi:phosphatidylinositol 4-kinase